MKKLLDYLAKLGFSESEAMIYMKLLESGPMTVAEMASAVKINRTAIYPYVYSLLDKGVIAELMIGSQKQFAATDPEQLQNLIDKKKESIRSIESRLPDILIAINTTFQKDNTTQKAGVKSIKGISNAKAIYAEAFAGSEFRSFVTVAETPFLLTDNTVLFNNALKKNKKLRMWEIIYETKFSKQQAIKILTQSNNYFCKFMSSDLKWSLTPEDILIYDGKVAVINYSDNISSIVLQSEVFYNNFKQLFDFLWRFLPEPDHK